MALDERITIGLAAGVAFIGLVTIGFIGTCIWAARRRNRVKALKDEAADPDRRICDVEFGDTTPAPLSKGSSTTSANTAAQRPPPAQANADEAAQKQHNTHTTHESSTALKAHVDSGC